MYETRVNERYTEIVPYEIWVMIVTSLQLKDIASFALTSSEGHLIARDKYVWTFKAWQHYLIKQSEKIDYPNFLERYHKKYNEITNTENRKILSMIIDDDFVRLEKMNLSLDKFHTRIDGCSFYYWAYKNSFAICKSIFDKAWNYYYDTTNNKIDIKKICSKGWTILHWAVTTQSVTLINQLILEGANIERYSHDGSTPLFVAANFAHLEAIKTLLAADAYVNVPRTTDGATPLLVAAQCGHLDVVKFLLAADADVNASMNDGATPLLIAAQNGHLNVIDVLLAAHADVNARVDDGATPLLVAARHGHLDIVKVLIDAGADVKAHFTDGATPLYEAAMNDYFDVVKVLIDAHADVNAPCTNGATPLYIAAAYGYLDVVKFLIDAHADVDASCTTGGSTSLCIAAKNSHLDVVDALLAAGADINRVYPFSGKTLFEMASDKNNTELLNLLAKHKLIKFLNETSKPTVYPQKTLFSRIHFFSDLLSAEAAAQHHQAALALAEVVFNGATLDSLEPHLKKLKTGELGIIFKILIPSIEKEQQIREEKDHAFTELRLLQNSL